MHLAAATAPEGAKGAGKRVAKPAGSLMPKSAEACFPKASKYRKHHKYMEETSTNKTFRPLNAL